MTAASGHTAEQIAAEGEFWRRYHELRGRGPVAHETALVLADHCEQHGRAWLAADWRLAARMSASSGAPVPRRPIVPRHETPTTETP